MGNNTYNDVLGKGKCKISVNGSIIVLYNVLYVPNIRRNLISVPILDDKGYSVKFKSKRVYISRGKISVNGTKEDNMYFLKVDNKRSISNYVNVSNDESYLWHLRLGLNAKQVTVVCTKIKQALRFSKVSQMVLVICKKTHLVPLLTFR
jgi:hypothetical protein